MSKAILVLEKMPNHCMGCPLKSRVHGIQGITHCCNLAEGMISLEEGFQKRLDNCPLKDIPKEKPVHKGDTYNDGWCDGYNSCLNDIESY